MWVFPILFIVGVSSGRGVDLARRPMTLMAALLTLAFAVILIITLPGSQGCAGGTCIADAYFFIAMLALSVGVLGFLVGGVLCSVEESGTVSERQMRIARRCLYTIGIIFAVGSILVNFLSFGLENKRRMARIDAQLTERGIAITREAETECGLQKGALKFEGIADPFKQKPPGEWPLTVSVTSNTQDPTVVQCLRKFQFRNYRLVHNGVRPDRE